ncbi:cobalt-precorrin-6X reductase [Rhizobium sp. Root274]|uniref:cobalt-precorrin-6A reductase n=1 Tax=unclassified Rhizobium TaxID=2613769 RepID=UPI0007127817|nr:MULTISPECIES: cobalt-precorrin-6A reductase [unclassified Rhizobium]KQW28636.1 cobalt-precorrin-6X reductase [Rhizobium sp. Root1240]KRD28838.1 cobalt-precorrin-6X reductase [Rhizobium sp. Root274]
MPDKLPSDPPPSTSSAIPQKILILGGTAEARELASRLVDEGHAVTTSLAGRTVDPILPRGEVRIGGFGGADGLAAHIREHGYDRVIDATHPFARRISENAIKASAATGVPLELRLRPRWQKQPGDRWRTVDSLQAAAAALPAGATAFLALGRQYLEAFGTRGDCRFIIRMVDAPEAALPIHDYTLVLGKPASDAAREADLFTAHGVTHLVCRNSGGPAGYAKLIAARQVGLPVIMLERD